MRVRRPLAITALSYTRTQTAFLYSFQAKLTGHVPPQPAFEWPFNQTTAVRKIMSIRKNLRGLLGLSLALVTGSAFAQAVAVVEFYNKTLDAYFITGRSAEQQALDARSDFLRTGMTFDAIAAAASTPSTTRVCRFYINLPSPPTSTHFYGREGVDCAQIQAQNLAGFTYEDFDFAVAQPEGGVCPTGTKTVYRGFRAATGGKTPNHRYTTSPETYVIAQSQGYVGESVAFCATSSTDVTPTAVSDQKCGTFYYPGLRISYQSINTEGTPGSFQRFLSTDTTTFNGYSGATSVVERFASSPTISNMIIDGPTTWSTLGSSSIDENGLDDVYYSAPTVYPRDFNVGQVVEINRQLTYSRANSFGAVTQTGKTTFIGKEGVTVPTGTYSSACKFVTEVTTTYAGTGRTSTNVTTNWVANALGIVKTISDLQTTSPTAPTAQVTTTTEAAFVQPL